MLTFSDFRNSLTEDASTFNKPAVLGHPTETGHTINGVHYSHREGLHELAGEMYGTGLRGAEGPRLRDSSDHRIKSRVYFYNRLPHHGGKLPPPEAGLGNHVHETTLHGIFHPDHASDEERETIRQHKQKYLDHPRANASNAFESALVDAGYRGYTNGAMTVVLNHKSVPTKYLGNKHELNK